MEIQNKKIRCLTQKEAEYRSNLIQQGSISYNLFIKICKGEQYEAHLKIKFFSHQTISDCQNPLFLDFCGKKIHQLTINNMLQNEIKWDGNQINIPNIKQGQNKIEIHYENNYDKDGFGFHSFKDTYNQQYIYTNFVVIYCRRVFPCFDQPDLKAVMKLKVIYPQDWVIISNEEGNQKRIFSEYLKEGKKPTYLFDNQKIQINPYEYYVQIFKKTKLLPSYLFAIMAGPYKEITCQNSYKKIPMKIYVRESLMKYLLKLSDFIFEITNKSMQIFEDLFQTEFVFSKYDQIFVPELTWGAMENASIVAISENSLFREDVDSTKKTRLGMTVSHELSHHWFGNYVTMKWWNDVWLNESFADFISHYALYLIQKNSPSEHLLGDIWTVFNTRKAWGYKCDQQVTTHPISSDNLNNTDMAETVFDGITYAKGAAVIKQLFFLVSEKAFSEAMKSYFQKFAYKNSTLDDFINCLEESFLKNNFNQSFSLKKWKVEWICKAGLNSVQGLIDLQNQNLIVEQKCTLEMHPTLRNHKIKAAFFNSQCQVIYVVDAFIQNQPHTIIKCEFLKDYGQQVKAVLLNYQDEAFVKIIFDENSLQFFKENLSLIQCELTRTLIWQAFHNMVRDGILSSEEYLYLFIKHINNEQAESLIINQLEILEEAIFQFTPHKYREYLSDQVFDFISKTMLYNTTVEKQNLKLSVKNSLISFALSEQKLFQIIDWYKGKIWQNEELGLRLQWKIVQTLIENSKISPEIKEEIFNTQKEKDKSDQFAIFQQYYISINCNSEEKYKLWLYYLDKNNNQSNRIIEASMKGFRIGLQDPKKYAQLWAENLYSVWEERNKEFFKIFFQNLQPYSENFDENLNIFYNLKNQHQDNETFQKFLLEAIDNNQRKQKAFQLFINKTNIKI
ncbi:hypothetical protein IMG5_172390 [Ichthyophthirius multifiliis]|uniref:Aminopeptidase n=1 Tax=Ichthyophthirius multifiliis TaxID=5932 RepID=G0R1R5_ICHMU|nr:hypothetical protein IMG5_172390 [Ichthyophthirius multifiliis]EGR28567.1 hypothetical protein IMG5_172390 [Ichthyophthirius multifiliis]|eukprot:XP_004029803.1 hypothetical protein IMG5_172390 [Ichthyophthirius multifiliis]